MHTNTDLILTGHIFMVYIKLFQRANCLQQL